MEKLAKTARIIDRVLSVLWAALIALAAAGAAALLAGAVFAGPIADWNSTQPGSAVTLTTGMLKVWVHEPALTAGNVRALCVSLVFMIALSCSLALYTVRLLRGIVGELKEGRPFSETMPGRIRKAAVMVFVYAFITPIIPSIPAFYFLKMFDLERILSALPPRVGSMEISFEYNANIMAVIIGFMVLLLSLVFEYGARLQRESDETL